MNTLQLHKKRADITPSLRYRAKAARRPIRFWWHSFALVGIILLFWWQIPMTAILYEPRTLPQRSPVARAAYVSLDPSHAALLLRRSVSAWTLAGSSGNQNSGLELEGIELIPPLAAPRFLEQGALYPGSWEPSPTPTIAIPQTPVTVDASAPAPLPLPGLTPPPPETAGYRLLLSPSLKQAGFNFGLPATIPPERSGTARFHLETDHEGRVDHLLLLSPATPSATWLTPHVFKAQGKTATTGTLEVVWWFPKS